MSVPGYRQLAVEEVRPSSEPFYVQVGNEVEIFRAAYARRIPVLLKGPTGCGKTRFVEYMCYELSRETGADLPLITVACHEDLTAHDLVGRYLVGTKGEVTWLDGPLTRAAKHGGICYLDEIVEARKDTTVVIHPLTDHRRQLPIEKLGTLIEAHPDFLLVMSYNPGYQSALKDLKHSTRQRFVSIEFGYPPVETAARVVAHETGLGAEVALRLAEMGEKLRNLGEDGLLIEGPSTRALIYTGRLIGEGVAARLACRVAIVWALSDDRQVQEAMDQVVTAFWE